MSNKLKKEVIENKMELFTIHWTFALKDTRIVYMKAYKNGNIKIEYETYIESIIFYILILLVYVNFV